MRIARSRRWPELFPPSFTAGQRGWSPAGGRARQPGPRGDRSRAETPHAREAAPGLASRTPPRQARRRSRSRTHRSLEAIAQRVGILTSGTGTSIGCTAAAQPPRRCPSDHDARTARSAGLTDVVRRFPDASFVSISDDQRRLWPGEWRGTVHHGLPLTDSALRTEKGPDLAFLGRLTAEKRPESASVSRAPPDPALHRGQAASRRKALFQGAGRTVYRRHADQAHRRSEDDEAEAPFCRGRCAALSIDWPEPFGLVMIEAMAVDACHRFPLRLGPEVVDEAFGFVVDDEEQVFSRETVAGIDAGACAIDSRNASGRTDGCC